MLTSTSVADALLQLGFGGTFAGLVAHSEQPMCGEAFTVHLCPPGESDRPFNDFLEEIPPGAVIVVDNAGRRGSSVFGGLMCAESRRRGALGAVVHGDVRDVAEARQLGFGLYALGRTPRSGRPDSRLLATNQPVDWGGTRIEPGDLVVADGDGVAVVPSAHGATVAELARDIEASDAMLLDQVCRGVPLAVARAQRGSAHGAPGPAGGTGR